ncbi:MAG: UTP--glucose-1-phosphate uridylyltransferase GalU [Alphaproteobacteria bacterium]|nr:UTP--glucose-1-phosphate uridylyltransferase GalU [Alphaproteobacteria bacterium]
MTTAHSGAQRVRKAVLPVAGFGTRVLPATKTIPKELLPVFDRPAIQYVVDEAIDAGIEHLVFITGRNKGAIEDYFDRAFELEESLRNKNKTEALTTLDRTVRAPGAMSFVRQQAALGLGHAVWCARDIIGDEPFAVCLPDMLMMGQPSCLRQMVDAYAQVGGNMIAVEPTDNPSGYGIIDPASRDGRLIRMKGMVEKPAKGSEPSNLFISGRYILQPEIFALLENQAKGAGGEIQLTDSMARLMDVQAFHAFEFEGRSYDCGDKLGYLEAVAAFALTNAEFAGGARAMLEKTLADPSLR